MGTRLNKLYAKTCAWVLRISSGSSNWVKGSQPLLGSRSLSDAQIAVSWLSCHSQRILPNCEPFVYDILRATGLGKEIE